MSGFFHFSLANYLSPLLYSVALMKGNKAYRYSGYYSTIFRGMRKKTGADDAVPVLMRSDEHRRTFRKNWALLIQ